MREIKVRVWDDFEEEGIRHAKFNLTDLRDLRIYINELDSFIFNIDRYTGVKDKNGVEIYEGDIVRVSNLSNDDFLKFKIERITTVTYSGSGFYCLDNAGYVGEVSDSREKEVIGNIYENKELLSESI